MSEVMMPVIGQEPWGETLNACLESLYTSIESLESQITDLSTQLAALATQIDDRDETVAALEEQVAVNTAEINTNRTLVMSLNNDVLAMSPRVTALETSVAGHTTDIAANQTSITNLNNDLGAMFTRLNALEVQVSGNTDTLNSLGARVSAVEDRPDYVFVNPTYMFSTIAGAATGSQIRINNADPKLATMMDVRRLDADGADRSYGLSLLTTKSQIRLNDFNNSAISYRYRVTGPPTQVGADNWNIPVAWIASAGTLSSTKINVGLFINVPPQLVATLYEEP